jgi:dipeptidyl aminopeptidase/acylaminoacyl peptidase
MHSKAPLYVMESSGRLVKMELPTGDKTVLSDHGFYMMPTLRPSGDGRWLSYSGVMKGAEKTQYWLYDRHKHTERLVYEHPAWGGGIPAFSPDNRYLAISAGYDSRWADASRSGIYLYDTTTMDLHAVPLPALKANRTAWVSADWSQDGKALLILVRNAAAKEGFDYFSYRLATRRIEALSGRYNRKTSRHEFRSGTQAIPASEAIMPRSQLGERSAWSPGRNWHAYLDERQDSLRYQLLISSKEGVTRPVAAGRYEQCAGRPLLISGWLDERHLVYRNSMNYFIFDAVTGASSDLFSENDMPLTFTW